MLGTIVRFLESETEPPIYEMIRNDFSSLILPRKYEKVCIPDIEKIFVVTNVTYIYGSYTIIEITVVPEENYN